MRFTEAIKKVIDVNPNFGSRLQQAEKLARKWQKLGLMEGLEGANSLMRSNVAIMLENQGKQILRESNHTSTNQYHEQWVGIAMPLVRRFMHKLVAKDFVTVQAMSQPTGLVFYIDHQLGNDRKGHKKGGSLYGTDFKGKSGDFDYVMDTNLESGLYGAGAWGYSLNNKMAYFNAEVSVAGAQNIKKAPVVVAVGGGVEGGENVDAIRAIIPQDYNYDTRFLNDNGTLVDGEMILNNDIQIISIEYPSHIEKNGVDAFWIEAIGTQQANGAFKSATYNFANVYKQYTKINGKNLQFMVKLEKNTGSSADPIWVAETEPMDFETAGTKAVIKLNYHVQPETHNRGDFEYQGDDLQEDDIGIPEIQFKLSQKPIVPKTRKMKATWTQELVDDLNSLLAIDGEQEISNQLTEQITLETDLEIVAMIGKGAIDSGNLGYFSARPGFEIDTINQTNGLVTFAENKSYRISGKSEWYRNIGVPMQKVSNMIHQKTGKGGANFAIVSPEVATLFETIQGFSVNTDGTNDFITGGFTTVGSFRDRYKIYKNPYSVSSNTVIMGYTGTGFLDFGAAYCPYIPLIMTPNILEPTNLTPTKGVYTRYAKTMLRNDYYGALFIHGMESV